MVRRFHFLQPGVHQQDVLEDRLGQLHLLVTQLELTSLRNVVRITHTLASEPGLTDKVRVVLNRVGSDEGEISLKKAEETIGKPVYWQVPNDPKSVQGSRNAGVPLLQFAPKSKVQQSIIGLAQALCNKREPEAPKKEKRGFFSFK